MYGCLRAIQWVTLFGVNILLACGSSVYANEEFLGCYEALYDKSYLDKHKRQIVLRSYLEIKKAQNSPRNDEFEGILSLWVQEQENKQFINHGSCLSKGKELVCNGSLSGSAALPCLEEKDGVSNACRNFSYDDGKFKIERRLNAVTVSLIGKLEFIEKKIIGEHLYLSQKNKENNRFILFPRICKQG